MIDTRAYRQEILDMDYDHYRTRPLPRRRKRKRIIGRDLSGIPKHLRPMVRTIRKPKKKRPLKKVTTAPIKTAGVKPSKAVIQKKKQVLQPIAPKKAIAQNNHENPADKNPIQNAAASDSNVKPIVFGVTGLLISIGLGVLVYNHFKYIEA